MSNKALKNNSAVLPGVLVGLVVALVSIALNWLVPLVSPLLFAMIIGLLLANVGRRGGGLPAAWQPGAKLCMKTILRAGVVLLGLRLSIPAVISLGWGVIGVIVLTVSAVFVLTIFLGKWMRIGPTTTLLTATGTAICGAAAVAGMSAVFTDDDTEDVDDAAATAIASVTLFGSLAIVLIPALARALGLDTLASGVLVGASIHEVGQVVAAGGLMGPDVLDVAVVTKLGRVAMLAPLVAIVGVLHANKMKWKQAKTAAEIKRPPIVPLFVVGFLIMVVIRSLFGTYLPGWFLSGANQVSVFLLTMGMFAMGAGVNLRVVATTGLKALALGAFAGIVATVVTLGGIFLMI
ncbi:hypothetical protein BK816_08020 [Boudabousia tangfeifanii]|uniref:Sulfate exporter family transporter n=1 Tax=Boudabousia tangfeifanii TaxID=1912795 RepID=A0A1D9MLW8_9ACTO|nr:putative sulfate exporter family transporter [Boudabousia tangfeifanii]AOZ73238.1 hypothetical protein BK816_08020 [Boudabousia tangfeifanii]